MFERMVMKIPLINLLLILGLLIPTAQAEEEQVVRTFMNKGRSDLSIEKALPIFFPSYWLSSRPNLPAVVKEREKNTILGSFRMSNSLGGEMEVFLSKKISLALGAELKKKSPTDFIFGDVGSSLLTSDFQFQFDASLIPILGTVKFNIPYHNLRLYAGAGVGLYLGKIKMSWISNGLSGVGNDRIRASASAFIPHLNWGLDYRIAKGIALGLDMRYVMGSFDSFTIKDCVDPEMIGQKLDFRGASDGTNSFPWSIKGLSVGLTIKFKFTP